MSRISKVSNVLSQQQLYLTIGEAFDEIRRIFPEKSTVSREKVPYLFREPHILAAYRPDGRSLAYYFRSFVMLHNESMNVWTHFFGAFFLMKEASEFYANVASRAPFDASMVLIFAATSVLLHFASAGAHLLHNHSENMHCSSFYVDNAAVGIAAAGINFLAFSYSSLPQYYEALRDWFLVILVVGSVCVCTGVSYALAKFRRAYNWKTKLFMFGPVGAFFFFGCTPFLFKVYRWLLGDVGVDFQWHHVYHLFLFMIAATFYTTCFPECASPGQFDIFGHSHQIFHFLITCSHVAVIRAVLKDVESYHELLASRRRNPLELENVLSAFVAIALLDIIILTFLSIWYRQEPSQRKSE